MSVGSSPFEAVLDRVSNEQADAAAHRSGPWAAMRGWNSSFVGEGLRSQPWPGREPLAAGKPAAPAEPADPGVPNDVLTVTAAPAPEPKPAMDTSHFKRLSPEQIARDINLLASDTPAELKSKRRRFARLNHPDGCPSEWRDAATIRMKIANQMVDEALRRV